MTIRAAWITYLCLCGGVAPILSFSLSGQRLISRRKQHNARSHTHIIPKSTSILYYASTSSSLKSNKQATIQETSNELLYRLQQKAASTNSKSDDMLDGEINNLVRTLIDSKAKFNPATCIDGPLFASVHFIGDSPLWARIGAGIVRNIKGQKYTLDNMLFTNYAEIIGTNFYLKAVGTFKDEGPAVSSSPSSTSVSSANGEKSNPLGTAFASLFNSGNNSNISKQQSTSLPTPYDYSATVTGASIVLFQKLSVDLTIEGTGTVRVLYADDNLRIFLSPTDTNVTKGGGDWESEGLIVVQVRVDLVDDDWIDKL